MITQIDITKDKISAFNTNERQFFHSLLEDFFIQKREEDYALSVTVPTLRLTISNFTKTVEYTNRNNETVMGYMGLLLTISSIGTLYLSMSQKPETDIIGILSKRNHNTGNPIEDLSRDLRLKILQTSLVEDNEFMARHEKVFSEDSPLWEDGPVLQALKVFIEGPTVSRPLLRNCITDTLDFVEEYQRKDEDLFLKIDLLYESLVDESIAVIPREHGDALRATLALITYTVLFKVKQDGISPLENHIYGH